MSNTPTLTEIVNTIKTETGMENDKIHELIKSKINEFGDFVTELGAAHIIARELGVNISQEPKEVVPSTLEVAQLVSDINNVSLIGRIVRIYDKITFKKKDGTEGQLQPITVEDKTGKIRVVAWDQKAKIVEESNCKLGDPVRIIGGYTKQGKDGSTELHLGIRSQLQIRPSGIKDADLPSFETTFTKIGEIKGEEIDTNIRGKITQIDTIHEFERSDGSKGKKQTIIIGDETGEVNLNFWNEKVEMLATFEVNEIVDVIGLSAKLGLKGFIELHTTRFTSIVQSEEVKDIKVKRGFIGSSVKEAETLSKIAHIQESNKTVSVKGLVISVGSIHEFTRDDNSIGRVRNISISDDTGVMRVVFWDDKAQLVDEQPIDKIITILNGYTRKNQYSDIEIYCGKQTRINLETAPPNIINQYQVAFTNISEISEEKEEVHVRGLILELEPLRQIVTKNKETVDLRTFKLQDNTGVIRVTCWRDNTKKLENLESGDLIEVLEARIKVNPSYNPDLIVTKRSIIKVSNSSDFLSPDFISGTEVSEMNQQSLVIQNIENVKEGDEVKIRATVVKLAEKRYVYAFCPTCRKKIEKKDDKYICQEDGNIQNPEYRLLFSFTANDGTGDINVLCAGRIAENVMGITAEKAAGIAVDSVKAPYFYLKNKNFEYSEQIIEGKAKKNPFLDSLEIVAEKISKINFRDSTKTIVNQTLSE